MKRILLIRHGQTDWNSEGRWQGHIDVPLNGGGLEQAQALALHLKHQPITAIYSSDLLRARQTAAPLAQALGLPVHADARLRELNLGKFQGLTNAEISSQYPQQAVQMREDYLGFPFPGGESRRMMQGRALAAFREIAAREPGPEIVVVTHGGTIRVLLMALFEDRDDIRRFSLYNTSICTIEMEDERFYLTEAAATPHLIE